MPELFVELLSEEIPARMQRKAAGDLQRLVTNHLVEAGLAYEGAYASATPRRLILSVQGLPARSDDRQEERKGPRVGAPEKALAGFLRAAGIASVDEAEVVSDLKKGDFYVARTTIPGRAAIDVCAEAVGEAIKRFPWPVSMRWGAASADAGSLRWVRPLTSILATFGADNEDPEVVPVVVEGVPVGDTTVGHRFHAPGAIKVRRLDDYGPALERAKVVVDLDRRRELIADGAKNACFALGLDLVADERLLEEVAGLVEWPVVLVGRFDEATLALPDEVIRLTIRENQKCFVTRDPATGALSNAFVLTANIEASDGGAAVIAGNERVVRARLADAQFFFEQDRKKPLLAHAEGLAAMTFHDKLGTQAERVERIAALARDLAPIVGADPEDAEQAARIAKADLTTQMVGEFPELQGYVGRHYALSEGLPPAVAEAVEEHYAPLGPKDPVPTAPVSVAVAIADKAVALTGLWMAGEKPTGSGDPFALRRAALGIVRIILENDIRLPLADGSGGLIPDALRGWGSGDGGGEIVDFVLERFVVQQRDAGVPAEIVRAVLPALEKVDLVDVTRRIAELRAFLETEDGATLMSGYRRATNILRAEEKKDGRAVEGPVLEGRLSAPQEKALADAVTEAGETVGLALSREDYAAAMEALAKLRVPVDDFFEAVLVNDEDATVRENRLRLLAALRDVTQHVADFSEIPG